MVARKQSSKSQERAEEGGNYFAKQQEGVEFFSTGCKTLDLALGGGWAEDRVVNVVGDNSTGKTLLAIEAGANFAKKYPGGKGTPRARIRYRESEKAFDVSYAGAIGLPLDFVEFGDEDPMRTVEDLYDEIDFRCKNAKPDVQRELMIVDSLDSLSSEAELKRSIDEDSYAGEKAKKISELFRRLTGPMSDAHMTLFIISQTRDKIGVRFGKKWTRTGGKALNFYASQILYLAHMQHVWGTYKGVKRPTGDSIRAKVEKLKVGLPFRQVDFDILFGFGIDDLNACIDWAKIASIDDKQIYGDMKRTAFLNWMQEKASKEDYAQEMARIHKVVEDRWWEIEEGFLPTRRKY